jgi:citrate lyase subunit alpha/citrate CoA-transferase
LPDEFVGERLRARRKDLIEAIRGSTLPIRPIEEIQKEVLAICGGPSETAKLTEHPVAVVKWVDGTVLDTVWQVGELKGLLRPSGEASAE